MSDLRQFTANSRMLIPSCASWSCWRIINSDLPRCIHAAITVKIRGCSVQLRSRCCGGDLNTGQEMRKRKSDSSANVELSLWNCVIACGRSHCAVDIYLSPKPFLEKNVKHQLEICFGCLIRIWFRKFILRIFEKGIDKPGGFCYNIIAIKTEYGAIAKR